MGIRAYFSQAAAGERLRTIERAAEEANLKEYSGQRYDTIDWETGDVWRRLNKEYFRCGEVLKDGRITWRGKISGRVIDGRPVYRKEFEE